MRLLNRSVIVALGCVALAVGLASPALTQTEDAATEGWVLPRTADGHPDMQGNWTNATMTLIERPPGYEQVLTPEQVAALEGDREELIQVHLADSDPDRGVPPAGGVTWSEGVSSEASSTYDHRTEVLDRASGDTGGYNIFYIDPGDHMAIWNGEARSSLIVDPPDGRIPSLSPEGEKARGELMAHRARFGEFDNPENRPLAERCLLSFGSNAGPPMVPNYFYNNNYTIVQTADHVMIMTEMVHDARIIRLGERKPLPAHIRPWLGDSWGHWEGDTLVVETTNLPRKQLNANTNFAGGSDDFTVTERFTRVDAETINYEFTVEDPALYSSSWTAQIPFKALPDMVYEYACHEGNYAMFNVLSGGRAQERESGDAGGDSR